MGTQSTSAFPSHESIDCVSLRAERWRVCTPAKSAVCWVIVNAPELGQHAQFFDRVEETVGKRRCKYLFHYGRPVESLLAGGVPGNQDEDDNDANFEQCP